MVQKHILNMVAEHGKDVTNGEKFSACGYENIYIGKGSIISAGAIVSGEVPEYSIYLGKKDIRPRFNQEELAKHQEAMNIYETIR